MVQAPQQPGLPLGVQTPLQLGLPLEEPPQAPRLPNQTTAPRAGAAAQHQPGLALGAQTPLGRGS